MKLNVAICTGRRKATFTCAEPNIGYSADQTEATDVDHDELSNLAARQAFSIVRTSALCCCQQGKFDRPCFYSVKRADIALGAEWVQHLRLDDAESRVDT